MTFVVEDIYGFAKSAVMPQKKRVLWCLQKPRVLWCLQSQECYDASNAMSAMIPQRSRKQWCLKGQKCCDVSKIQSAVVSHKSRVFWCLKNYECYGASKARKTRFWQENLCCFSTTLSITPTYFTQKMQVEIKTNVRTVQIMIPDS